MRSYIILFAIFFGGVVHLHSQSVSGYVNDLEDGSVLPFVSVTVQGTSIGTLSDIDGYFSSLRIIRLLKQTFIIIFRIFQDKNP